MLINSNPLNYNPLFQAKEVPKAELERLLEMDKSVAQIAKKLGVSPKTIFKRIKSYNLKLPTERQRERFQKEALPLLQQGISLANIRKLTGIKEQYTRTMIKRNSLPSSEEFLKIHLKELVQENYSDEKIADILNLNTQTVKNKRTKLGLKKELGRRKKELDWQAIVVMLKNGTPIKDITQKYSISQKLLDKKIKEIFGVSPKKIIIDTKRDYISNCLFKGDSIVTIANKLQVRREPLYKFIQKYLPEWVSSRK